MLPDPMVLIFMLSIILASSIIIVEIRPRWD